MEEEVFRKIGGGVTSFTGPMVVPGVGIGRTEDGEVADVREVVDGCGTVTGEEFTD